MRLLRMVRDRLRRKQVYPTKDFWDRKAQEYTGLAVSLWPNEELDALYHEEHCRIVNEALGEVAGLMVLDLGCGTGRMTRQLAQRGAMVTGVDFSPKALAAARRATADDPAAVRITWREQSVFELGDVARYDAVVIIAVWCMACQSSEDLLRAARVLRRACKENARVVVIEPIHRGFLSRTLSMGRRPFCAALRAAGFQIAEVSQIHFWPVRLILGHGRWPRWLTVGLYRIGEWLLVNAFRGRVFGDYTVIRAVACRGQSGGAEAGLKGL